MGTPRVEKMSEKATEFRRCLDELEAILEELYNLEDRKDPSLNSRTQAFDSEFPDVEEKIDWLIDWVKSYYVIGGW